MATKKVVAKKAPAKKKVVAKKAPAKKAVAKKTAAKKPAAKKTVRAKTIGYTTSNVFPKHTIKQVWDAAVLGKHLKKHFVDDMKGECGPDLKPVSWFWKEWGWMEIKVLAYKEYEQIVFEGMSMDGKSTIIVTYDFLEKDGRTIFRISEAGYPATDLKGAFMMCEGWTEFHCGVKAYLMNGTILNR